MLAKGHFGVVMAKTANERNPALARVWDGLAAGNRKSGWRDVISIERASRIWTPLAADQATRHTRSPPGCLSDTSVRPSFFFNAPANAPRTVCARQPVAAQIWLIVAPSGR